MQSDAGLVRLFPISEPFARIGARLLLRPMFPPGRNGLHSRRPPLEADIARDSRGEYFDLAVDRERVRRLFVLDARPRERHLVLMCRQQAMTFAGAPILQDSRLLCGHDERAWFVAAIRDDRRVTTVDQAMEALKPNIVRNSQRRHGVRRGDLNRRRNAGFVRQGEWFFVPDPTFDPRDRLWHRHEPLVRGRGKPHVAEQLIRFGGRMVWANRRGAIRTEGAFREQVRLGTLDPFGWRPMMLEPNAYVRGWVRHPDHATVTLSCWHRVVPNNEASDGSGRLLKFID